MTCFGLIKKASQDRRLRGFPPSNILRGVSLSLMQSDFERFREVDEDTHCFNILKMKELDFLF
jgi:hypothetical protein